MVLLIGPAPIALVLATGIYVRVAEWGADAWILVSLVSLVALAGIGGVLTGAPTARITPAAGKASGPVPEELRRDLRSPLGRPETAESTGHAEGTATIRREPDERVSYLRQYKDMQACGLVSE